MAIKYPRTRKGSENARAVAREVIRRQQAGEKVNLRQILLSKGYSNSVANAPGNVTQMQSYKDEVSSFTDRLEQHRNKILAAMEKKNLDEEQYRTLIEAERTSTHDIQLLTGGKTENVGMEEDRKTLIAIINDIRGVPHRPAPEQLT